MITEKDLLEAIAECQGQRNPNANTCIKLAAYYTILQNMREAENESEPEHSERVYEAISVIDYDGDSEFSKMINGRDLYEILPIIDEVMTTLQVVNPRLYNSVVRKLNE